MCDQVTRSSTPPSCELLKGVWDFKAWIIPFLADIIKNHSYPLVFRFTRTPSGKTELHYKRFSYQPWEPKDSGLNIITVRKHARTRFFTVQNFPHRGVLMYKFLQLLICKDGSTETTEGPTKYKPWVSATSWESWTTFMESTAQFDSVQHLD